VGQQTTAKWGKEKEGVVEKVDSQPTVCWLKRAGQENPQNLATLSRSVYCMALKATGDRFFFYFFFFFLVGLLFIRIRIYYMDVAVLVCLLVCLFVRQPVCVRSKCGRTIFNYTF